MKEKIVKKEAKWLYCEDKTGQDGWRCSSCRFFVPWYYNYYESPNFITNYHYCPRCNKQMTSFTGNENISPVITINQRL